MTRRTGRRSAPITSGRFAQLSPVQACSLGTKGPFLSIVVGAIHGFHFIPMAAEFGRRDGKAVLGRTMGACPPLPGLKDGDDYSSGCSAFNDATLRELATLKQQGLTGVLIASRWYNLGRRCGRKRCRRVSMPSPGWDCASLLVAPVPEFPPT